MSKLSYENKINLYNDRKNGMSINSLVSKYGIRHEGVKYLIRLIDKLELAKMENKEISNTELLDRLKELIPMIRPNLEKLDKSKYPKFDRGLLPKTEIKPTICETKEKITFLL